jgi:hypothetical protein
MGLFIQCLECDFPANLLNPLSNACGFPPRKP